MLSEVSGALKDRLGSSIVGTLTLSFGILNWRFFVILFSGIGVEPKIQQAEDALYGSLVSNIIISVFVTLIVLFLVPFLKVLYDSYFFKMA